MHICSISKQLIHSLACNHEQIWVIMHTASVFCIVVVHNVLHFVVNDYIYSYCCSWSWYYFEFRCVLPSLQVVQFLDCASNLKIQGCANNIQIKSVGENMTSGVSMKLFSVTSSTLTQSLLVILGIGTMVSSSYELVTKQRY